MVIYPTTNSSIILQLHFDLRLLSNNVCAVWYPCYPVLSTELGLSLTNSASITHCSHIFLPQVFIAQARLQKLILTVWNRVMIQVRLTNKRKKEITYPRGKRRKETQCKVQPSSSCCCHGTLMWSDLSTFESFKSFWPYARRITSK